MKTIRLRAPASLAKRLLLFSGFFVTAALVVASIILWLALKNVVREQIDQRLDTQISALANAVQPLSDGRLSLSTPMDAPPFDRSGSGWYWQIDADGQHLTSRSLIQGAMDAPPPRQSLKHMLTGMASPGEARDKDGQALYTRQITRSIHGTMMTITASAPSAALVDPALRALFWLIPCMLLLGIVLLGGTLWQIRFGLRPLASMVADIDAINRGDLERLPQQPSPELAPLSAKTNALLIANEERLIATRMQFANLAHGLKTPVASLLLALSDSNDPDGTLRDLGRRIDHRIKHHLSSTRQAMATGGRISSAPLADTVANLHLAISSIHADKDVRFETEIDGDFSVACEENDLEEMLGNLIENAFKWTSSTVKVVATKEGSNIRISIEDDGPGIANDRMDAVLLPGVREDERISGTGFGLTIANELAELYSGSLLLENNSPRGLKAVLVLPATVPSRAALV
ncbi:MULTISPECIES: sensor histidine kinase [Agrobacterium]|uniref:histidine kinase n=1 Tax=Agrobacterium rosae TaxID=1972867 RepID=A0A1R3TEZ1_9HYPH|nr:MULTISPECIES: HAMP domain-containing sensor histidine kinase [Agrobacterium]KAA3515874.1 sensor histidine kinase [Agrobacterium rosae]KAA3524828.1 sensor histidine kinase [Agrobacterium rosae]MCM2431790.1 HAMP domain-containing histidine kinase [Agrobacterium rosae]MDX8312213.1 HAMP domain-containing sensor histidine kinase [Agrobacterium rosae]MDX8328544.1 HAMP domain-containing sensor histidine kinase [Agrobacterium rosae]